MAGATSSLAAALAAATAGRATAAQSPAATTGAETLENPAQACPRSPFPKQ